MKYSIELTGAHVVTKGPRDKSWTASASVDLEKLPKEIVSKLVVHGLQQKVADAAAGAATADEAQAAMEKAINAILAGEWSSRSAGSGVDEETRVARMVVRRAVKAKFGSKSPEWTKFTGLSDDEQNAKLDEWRTANEAAFAPAIAKELEARAAERESRKGLSGTIAIEL